MNPNHNESISPRLSAATARPGDSGQTGMRDVILIEDGRRLMELVQQLSSARHIAVDTESNGFFAYYERICLVQISTEQDDYIVDPLAVDDLHPLAGVFADPAVEKIFHAASNDLSGLKRDFGFHFANVFDTAVASKMLGRRRLGLATILQEHFAVELNKKWQRCDWGKRPLCREQLNYARLDTHYLIPLRHQLASALKDSGLWEQARESFAKLCEVQTPDRRFSKNGVERIRGANRLHHEARSVLKSLCRYRDRIARRRDRAPFRVISNETLLRLAHALPQNMDELQRIKGLPKTYRKGRSARKLLHVIQSAQPPGEVTDRSE